MATDPRQGGDAGGGGGAPPVRVCEPLGAEWAEAAAAILADCAPERDGGDGRALLAAARAEPGNTLYALIDGGELVALYGVRKRGLALEISLLVVAAARRRRGFGRACLHDALRRAGKRPLVAEADNASLPFFRAVGFKLVGKRRTADGSVRYRLGWHAPRPATASAAAQVRARP